MKLDLFIMNDGRCKRFDLSVLEAALLNLTYLFVSFQVSCSKAFVQTIQARLCFQS